MLHYALGSPGSLIFGDKREIPRANSSMSRTVEGRRCGILEKSADSEVVPNRAHPSCASGALLYPFNVRNDPARALMTRSGGFGFRRIRSGF
jgi:hypothetical protein